MCTDLPEREGLPGGTVLVGNVAAKGDPVGGTKVDGLQQKDTERVPKIVRADRTSVL